ncbi:MAG: hypothetical protein JWP74_17 [Marmoricola sp.]|nr:hypothetical protein [Marmoricola sp.]
MRGCALVLLFLGGAGYADWALQLVLPISTSPITSYISELSAHGQPFAAVFRATDTVSGVLIMAGAAGGWFLARRWWPTWGALVLLGASNVLEAMSPMRCVLTFAAACTPPVKQALLVTIFNPHAWVSVLQTMSCFVVVGSCIVALGRAGASPARWRFLAAVGALSIFVSLIEGLFTVELLAHSTDSVLGLVQRTEVTFTALFLALAPGCLLLLSRDRASPGTDAAAPGRRAGTARDRVARASR